MPSFAEFNHFLSSAEFMDQLRKEKRRAERSQSPLSIVLLNFDESSASQGKHLKLFLDFLGNKTRETDIKGWVNTKAIGLILPDTDRSGLERFVELIIQGNGHLNYTITKATYPDTLFESLSETSIEKPDLFPLKIDHSQTAVLQYFFKRVLAVVSSLIGY
jgi:hypothetical protein